SWPAPTAHLCYYSLVGYVLEVLSKLSVRSESPESQIGVTAIRQLSVWAPTKVLGFRQCQDRLVARWTGPSPLSRTSRAATSSTGSTQTLPRRRSSRWRGRPGSIVRSLSTTSNGWWPWYTWRANGGVAFPVSLPTS